MSFARAAPSFPAIATSALSAYLAVWEIIERSLFRLHISKELTHNVGDGDRAIRRRPISQGRHILMASVITEMALASRDDRIEATDHLPGTRNVTSSAGESASKSDHRQTLLRQSSWLLTANCSLNALVDSLDDEPPVLPAIAQVN